MSALPSRRYRVVVVEWLSHVGVIEATSKEAAKARALEIWGTETESGTFTFEDSGVSDVMIDELPA